MRKSEKTSEAAGSGVTTARLILLERRITVGEAAAAIGVNREHLTGVLSGRRPASRLIRAAVARYLGLPESECFTDGRQPVGSGVR